MEKFEGLMLYNPTETNVSLLENNGMKHGAPVSYSCACPSIYIKRYH